MSRRSTEQLASLSIATTDTGIPSDKTFVDDGQYRIEIPSTEGPEAFRAVLEQADTMNVTVHRISQGSGIQMLTDDEIREMAHIGADRWV